MFLQLIRELNHSINSNRSNQWDKVNTDVVLQLLSCNITISHLYQMLCSQLCAWSAPPGEWDKGSVLPSLRFEGLAQMDTKLHLSTLVHVCGHVFVKIQKELEEMQQREFLAQAAHTTFQIALGAAGRENEVVGRGQSSVKTNVVETLQLRGRTLILIRWRSVWFVCSVEHICMVWTPGCWTGVGRQTDMYKQFPSIVIREYKGLTT